MRRAGIAVALLLLVPLPGAGIRTAVAKDTLAPAAGSDHWLPKEDWVYRHWSPFSEAAVRDELALTADQFEAYLLDDRRTFAALARERGKDPVALRDRLIAHWRPLVDDGRFAVLRDHATRVLTPRATSPSTCSSTSTTAPTHAETRRRSSGSPRGTSGVCG